MQLVRTAFIACLIPRPSRNNFTIMAGKAPESFASVLLVAPTAEISAVVTATSSSALTAVSCDGYRGIVVRQVCCTSDYRDGGEVIELAFSAGGDYFITGTRDRGVRVWSVHSGESEVFVPPLAGTNEDGGYHAGHLSCDIIVDPSHGVLMPAGSATGGVNVWHRRASTRRMAELRGNGHPYGVAVDHLAAYPDGRFFISADRTTMKVWSTEDFKCKRTIRSPFEIQIVKVSSKCRFVFCAGEGKDKCGMVVVWNGGKSSDGRRRDIKPIRLLQGHGRPIRSLHAPENQEVLVTTSLDGRVKVWDVPSGACTRTFWSKGGLYSQLSNAALVNRAAWMLTSYADGSIQVWGLEDGKCRITLGNSRGTGCKCLAVSRCGRLVAFAIGARLTVIDFDKLVDRSRAARPREPGMYLQQALQFLTGVNRTFMYADRTYAPRKRSIDK